MICAPIAQITGSPAAARQAPGRIDKPGTIRPHPPENKPQNRSYGKFVSGSDGIGCGGGDVGGNNGVGPARVRGLNGPDVESNQSKVLAAPNGPATDSL
jgi:hypothetical protein